MRRPRLTLRGRVAWTVAAAVLTSTVATTVVAYELERRGSQDCFVASSAATATADTAELERIESGQPTLKAAIATACNYFTRRDAGFEVYNLGVSACDSGALPNAPEGRDDVQGYFDFWANGGRTWATERLVSVGALHFGFIEYFDFAPEQAQLRRLRNDLVLLDALAVVVAATLGMVVAGGITRPVRRMAQAFRRFGEGELTARVPERGSAELAGVARDFNLVVDQLERAVRELDAAQTLQHRFVADVSHELRSPLAAMVAANDGLDHTDPTLRARAVALVQQQTRRLNRMVDDLLEISRFDAGQATLELESVDLYALTDDAVRTVAPDEPVRITAFGDVHVDVDARRIHAVLRNLVGNAIQHGAPPVDIVVDATSDPVSVTVADDGPGVPPELTDTIFDRFVRADTSRAGHGDSLPSTGLGLAIAAENTRLHGGTLEVSRTGRSAFTIRLPRHISVPIITG